MTNYHVIDRLQSPVTTRVTFKPVSGRTHQLRIHSSEIGHPILGCDLYATDEAFFMAKRLMLHATSIEFDHPVTGKRINGLAPVRFSLSQVGCVKCMRLSVCNCRKIHLKRHMGKRCPMFYHSRQI